jgi:hypothetical protein
MTSAMWDTPVFANERLIVNRKKVSHTQTVYMMFDTQGKDITVVQKWYNAAEFINNNK